MGYQEPPWVFKGRYNGAVVFSVAANLLCGWAESKPRLLTLDLVVFFCRAIYQLHLVKIEKVRPATPPEAIGCHYLSWEAARY